MQHLIIYFNNSFFKALDENILNDWNIYSASHYQYDKVLKIAVRY